MSYSLGGKIVHSILRNVKNQLWNPLNNYLQHKKVKSNIGRAAKFDFVFIGKRKYTSTKSSVNYTQFSHNLHQNNMTPLKFTICSLMVVENLSMITIQLTSSFDIKFSGSQGPRNSRFFDLKYTYTQTSI